MARLKMSWKILGVKKPWYRRMVAAVVDWAMKEDLDELYARDNQLHGYISNLEREVR